MIRSIACFLLVSAFFHQPLLADPADRWTAGVARIDITLSVPMWMAGYGNRDHPAEGKLHSLWAKALVLSDAAGRQAVLITLDICSFPKEMSDRICGRIMQKRSLQRSQIIVNCSHTHSGPVVMNSLFNIYPLDEKQTAIIKAYSDTLEIKIVQAVDSAFQRLRPARLFSENGMSTFQVNRRNNNEPTLLLQHELKGPNDYAVPVLKIQDTAGHTTAILFGYACHNTVLNGYQWSGDYAGFAQMEIEKLHPNAIALFFQGAGADQNPLPRRTVSLAIQYGRELAYAVEKVLNEEMHPLQSDFASSYSQVSLKLNDPPAKEELRRMCEDSSSFKRRSAQRLLSSIERGESVFKEYLYPVQVWRLGDLPVFALGGELVVQYAIELKKLFGLKTFVMGYCNDIMAYIPSATILRESNHKGMRNVFYDPGEPQKFSYEGGIDSQMEYGLPATWQADVELKIMDEASKLAVKAGIPLAEYR